MNDHISEGATSEYEFIKSMTSLLDILATATAFEASARDFYRDLIPRVGKNFRWVLEDLVEEEQRHHDLLTELAQRDDVEDALLAEIERPVTHASFAEAVMTPDLAEHPDDQAVLQYAMSREKLAMEHYQSLVASTAPGPIQEAFEYLAHEEIKHQPASTASERSADRMAKAGPCSLRNTRKRTRW
jgi:rubrerythrin